MLTLIIVFLLIAFIVALFTWADGGEFFEGIFVGFFSGLAAAVVTAFVIMIIGAFVYTEKEWRVVGQVEMINIADGDHAEGHWSLFSGSIDGVPHYSWYEKTGDNTYQRRNIDADSASVHYTSDKPYLTVSKEYHTSDPSFFQKWLINPNGEEIDYTDISPYYDFYIPAGSIKPEFELDAK